MLILLLFSVSFISHRFYITWQSLSAAGWPTHTHIVVSSISIFLIEFYEWPNPFYQRKPSEHSIPKQRDKRIHVEWGQQRSIPNILTFSKFVAFGSLSACICVCVRVSFTLTHTFCADNFINAFVVRCWTAQPDVPQHKIVVADACFLPKSTPSQPVRLC